MTKTAYLNARIDPALKSKAEKILSSVGVSASQAITMFYQQVVLRRGIPFDVRIPNAETVAALKEAASAGGDTMTGSTEDAFDGIIAGNHNRRG
jgi:DNA-damage-inducible protein J